VISRAHASQLWNATHAFSFLHDTGYGLWLESLNASSDGAAQATLAAHFAQGGKPWKGSWLEGVATWLSSWSDSVILNRLVQKKWVTDTCLPAVTSEVVLSSSLLPFPGANYSCVERNLTLVPATSTTHRQTERLDMHQHADSFVISPYERTVEISLFEETVCDYGSNMLVTKTIEHTKTMFSCDVVDLDPYAEGVQAGFELNAVGDDGVGAAPISADAANMMWDMTHPASFVNVVDTGNPAVGFHLWASAFEGNVSATAKLVELIRLDNGVIDAQGVSRVASWLYDWIHNRLLEARLQKRSVD
jgi:hypothetical protein